MTECLLPLCWISRERLREGQSQSGLSGMCHDSTSSQGDKFICLQVQRELKAAKAESQRVKEDLEIKEAEALKLRAQLELMKAAPPPAEDLDSWLVSGNFGDT